MITAAASSTVQPCCLAIFKLRSKRFRRRAQIGAMVEAPMSSAGSRANDRDQRALEFIENVTRNADEVQKQVLSGILTRNSDTEYLKRYGLNGETDRETFKKCLPVITYDDLKPEISRIANGDTSPILSAHPISEFVLSTGTSSGRPKLVPTIEEDMERRALLISLVMPIMNQYFPGLDKGKGMYFQLINSEAKTPGGLLARCSSTRWYKSRFLKERSIYDRSKVYTSPLETILCPDAYQSMYCQLLCGLLQNCEVLRMGAIFASGFIRIIRFLEEHWRQLCLDIKAGILNKEVTDPSVREAVEKLLQHPNPELAELIQRECSAHSWQGILSRLWPNTKYIKVIVTGTMAQYILTLDYYSGGLPLVCTMYSCSEGSFGLNLKLLCKPTEVSYTLLPNMAYFEFLPVHREEFGLTVKSSAIPETLVEKEEEDLVKLVDVKVGKEYELVVTTHAGLYRYRVGDILRVTGFHNAAPQFEFLCRENVVLSINTEKTDEAELQSSVENSVKHLEPFDVTLMDYTSYADTSTIPGHYVLYWELRFNTKQVTDAVPSSVFEDCCITIEESLNSVYRRGRTADKSIAPLEIRVVEEGTFDQLMDHALAREASINQYKAPRCVKSASMVELLNSRVIHSCFSRRCPKWVPEALCPN